MYCKYVDTWAAWKLQSLFLGCLEATKSVSVEARPEPQQINTICRTKLAPPPPLTYSNNNTYHDNMNRSHKDLTNDSSFTNRRNFMRP